MEHFWSVYERRCKSKETVDNSQSNTEGLLGCRLAKPLGRLFRKDVRVFFKH